MKNYLALGAAPLLCVSLVGLGAVPSASSGAAPAPPNSARDRALDDLTMGAPIAADARVAADRVVDLREVVIRLAPGVRAEKIAQAVGATVKRKSRLADGWVLAPNARQTSAALVDAVRRVAGVRDAFANRRLPAASRAFVPNDPYFKPGVPNAANPGQFYLVRQPGFAGGDVNVKPLWDVDVTGAGVRMAVVDDGLDYEHPDLLPNYDPADSIDVESGSADPRPREAENRHGTFVAGTMAARGGNGIGITGTAPLASLAGIRVPLGGNFTDEIDVAAIEHGSVGPNPRIAVKNHSYGPTIPWIEKEGVPEAYARSSAAGTIHVLAAGNERGLWNQDVAKGMSTSLADVLVVGAINQTGRFASYSNFGSSLTATAYGGDFAPLWGHLSTDRRGTEGYSSQPGPFVDVDGTGDYVGGNLGTSFTAPVVAGVMALAKQVQPALNVRWAKHLLARTCVQNDPEDDSLVGGWTRNAAGTWFNPNYGFGLVDAAAFVALARETQGVSALQTARTARVNVNRAIPDRGSLVLTFLVSARTPLEEVLISLKASHLRRGQLEAYLTSPRGTRSRLFIRSNRDILPNLDWTLMTNAFWGERPNGVWKLEIRDTASGFRGVLESYQASFRMGTLIQGVQP